VNREKLIQEQRTIEAMKKGYMGLEGKFVTIANRLGYVLYKQGGINFEQSFLEDYYNLPADENVLPTMDEEEGSYAVGLAFDGLSRGMNLSIVLQYHNREITVRHEGQVVYKEVAGDLEGFAPDDAWEQKIDRLFSLCKKVERQSKPAERKMLKELADKKRKEILENLRLKWGI
jgi:hypothetical protein